MEIQSPFIFGKKEAKFYNKELIHLFHIDVDEYLIFRLFLDSRFDLKEDTHKKIQSQKKDIIQLLTHPPFINELKMIINHYINQSTDTNKNKTLINFGNNLEKITPSTSSNHLLDIIRNTELLGDIILYYIVNAIITRTALSFPSLNNERFKFCQDKLKNFLNSNVFLYNIIKKLTSLNISDFLPEDFKYEIRLAKRANVDTNRIKQEILSPNCIDFKYYANLIEQTIGYTYITKGYKKTEEIFLSVLQKTGFVPEDFIKNCLELGSKPYNGLILQTGCSCKDQENKSLCDNPGYFDPKYFKNNSCPLNCPIDIEQFIKSNRDIQINILYTQSKNERESMIRNISNQSRQFFIDYVFNWKKSSNTISDTYFYFILDYLMSNASKMGISKSISDFVERLQNDIKIFQNEHQNVSSSESEFVKAMEDLMKNRNINFPRALAIYQRYSILNKNIKKEENDLFIGILNYLFSNMISDYKNILDPKSSIFTIGTKHPDKNGHPHRRGRAITVEREKYHKSTRSRSRSPSREEKRRKPTRSKSPEKKATQRKRSISPSKEEKRIKSNPLPQGPVTQGPVAQPVKFVIGQPGQRSSTKKIGSRYPKKK